MFVNFKNFLLKINQRFSKITKRVALLNEVCKITTHLSRFPHMFWKFTQIVLYIVYATH